MSPDRTEPLASPDEDVVVLVDPQGRTVGTAPRATVHTGQTPLHLAFSVYLFDADGRLLVTRRALSKVAWPGVWTNSCCGHLRPGESPIDAARRRVRDELGSAPTDLRVVLPDFAYRAEDPGGIVEHELCPVLAGRLDPASVHPDPEEVLELTWVCWDDVVALAHSMPRLLSPWAAQQVVRLGTSAFPGPTCTAADHPPTHAEAPHGSPVQEGRTR